MRRPLLIGLLLPALAAAPGALPAEIVDIRAQTGRAERWNRFVDGLLALHERQLDTHRVRVEKRVGGYAGRPRFFRELRYIERKSGRLLSVLQWERARPGNLHGIEVYVYDADGRLTRDYGAQFLPDARNAPIQTFINLHHYDGDLHSFRQFNASDERIYEDCRGTLAGEPVRISLGEYALPDDDELESGEELSAAYQACFDALDTSAGPYLTPQ